MWPANGHGGPTLTPSELPAASKSLSVLRTAAHTFKSSAWEQKQEDQCELSSTWPGPGQPELHGQTPWGKKDAASVGIVVY